MADSQDDIVEVTDCDEYGHCEYCLDDYCCVCGEWVS